MKKTIVLLLIPILWLGCQDKNEFSFDKEKIRAYKPNILFTNYRVLDCPQHILLKTKVDNEEIGKPISELDAKVNEGEVELIQEEKARFKWQGKKYYQMDSSKS